MVDAGDAVATDIKKFEMMFLSDLVLVAEIFYVVSAEVEALQSFWKESHIKPLEFVIRDIETVQLWVWGQQTIDVCQKVVAEMETSQPGNRTQSLRFQVSNLVVGQVELFQAGTCVEHLSWNVFDEIPFQV